MNNQNNKIFIKKLFFTFFIIAILRFLNFIPIPYVEQQNLINLLNSNSSLKIFFNQKNIILSIFTLGIIPNLNASFFMQYLISSSSFFKKLQTEEGKNGREKIKKFTRYLTLIFALLQSFPLVFALKPILFTWNKDICFELILLFSTGSMIVVWLSDLITEIGILNGSSTVLVLNIIGTLPNILPHFNQFGFNFISLFEFLPFLAFILAIIYTQETTKKIPLITINQLYKENKKFRVRTSQFSYIPFKLTHGSVMPILFASTFSSFLTFILNKFFNSININFLPLSSFFCSILTFIGIIFCNQFYAKLIINPTEISKELEKMGATIKNIRPGKNTTIYLKKVLNRSSLIGGIALAILYFFSQNNQLYTSGFNITSFIILIGIMAELSRKINDRNL